MSQAGLKMKLCLESAILTIVEHSWRSSLVRSRANPRFFPIAKSVKALRILAALGVICAMTFLFSRLVRVNATTVGFAYLVAILLVATAWGFPEAAAASFLAVLCFNFFFLPPIGTFNIADPQNWVALFAFLATSIIASQLSARAKSRTQEALDRRQEMERLYALSRAILLTETNQSAAKQIANQIAQIFEFPAVALYDAETDETHYAGTVNLSGLDARLRQAAVQPYSAGDEFDQTIVTRISLRGQPVGSIAIRGATLSRTALQAISNLVAIGLEKVRNQEAAGRAEAARQSEELKSTLIDAIAHEFKTPLTSIKAAATALLSTPNPRLEEQRELLSVVDEEADRLGRLVTEAIQTARIEAGRIQVNKGLHSVQALISTVLGQMKSETEGRKITVSIPHDVPTLVADAELMALAVRQLLDNALKYSPPASPLAVSAEKTPGSVCISVRDYGPGIPERQQSRIFGKFYRDPETRQQVTGTGMGLAIAREIVRAHGGAIWVESEPGHGAKFCISVPVTSEETAA